MPQPRVRIVIVNWNAGAWLANCLASIRGFAGPELVEVVVVDNGSVDGSERAADGPGVRLVRTGQNLGFAKACNLGAAGAETPYLLFFNPDAALRDDTLQKALRFMDSPEAAEIAVCGIRLHEEDGGVQLHTTTFPTPRTIYTHNQRSTAFDHLSSRDVDHVIGAFYLIRRPVFERLGGFDERFFVYLEDLDLSLRVHRAGWRIHYLAEAVGFHKGGGTSDQVKALRLFYSVRSRLLYARKHFSTAGVLYVFAVTFGLEPFARLLRALIRKSGQEAAQTASAYGMLLRALPAILRVRWSRGDARERGLTSQR